MEKVGVRWLERFILEREPTLSELVLAVSALSALPHESRGRSEALRLLRALAGSF